MLLPLGHSAVTGECPVPSLHSGSFPEEVAVGRGAGEPAGPAGRAPKHSHRHPARGSLLSRARGPVLTSVRHSPRPCAPGPSTGPALSPQVLGRLGWEGATVRGSDLPLLHTGTRGPPTETSNRLPGLSHFPDEASGGLLRVTACYPLGPRRWALSLAHERWPAPSSSSSGCDLVLTPRGSR